MSFTGKNQPVKWEICAGEYLEKHLQRNIKDGIYLSCIWSGLKLVVLWEYPNYWSYSKQMLHQWTTRQEDVRDLSQTLGGIIIM